MASEPERPIEKLLRDAAQKRRDEAPASFEPHPATRRMLQGEVARRYPQQGRGARSGLSWLWRISPKLSWAVASLAVIAVGVWLLWPNRTTKSQERLFARNETPPAAAQPPEVANSVATDRRLQPPVASEEHLSSTTVAQDQLSAPSAPGAPSVAFPQEGQPSVNLAKKSRSGIRSDLATSPPAAGGASLLDTTNAPSLALAMSERKAKPETTSTDVGGTFADKSLPSAPLPGIVQSKDGAPSANLVSGFASANQPVPSAAAAARQTPAPPAPGLSVAVSSEAAAVGDANGRVLQVVTNSFPSNVALAQHFVRNIPASKTFGAQNARAVDHRLLVSFQVEQNGPELRVKDEDGSVYFGYVQPAQTAAVLRDMVKAVPATSAGRTGNLKLTDADARPEPASPAPQTYFFRVTGTNQTLKLPVLFTGNISNAPGYGLSPTQLSGARISGRVRVGNQREFEVLASPH